MLSLVSILGEFGKEFESEYISTSISLDMSLDWVRLSDMLGYVSIIYDWSLVWVSSIYWDKFNLDDGFFGYCIL